MPIWDLQHRLGLFHLDKKKRKKKNQKEIKEIDDIYLFRDNLFSIYKKKINKRKRNMVKTINTNVFSIEELTKDELTSLERVITAAPLPDKRVLYELNKEIKHLLTNA